MGIAWHIANSNIRNRSKNPFQHQNCFSWKYQGLNLGHSSSTVHVLVLNYNLWLEYSKVRLAPDRLRWRTAYAVLTFTWVVMVVGNMAFTGTKQTAREELLNPTLPGERLPSHSSGLQSHYCKPLSAAFEKCSKCEAQLGHWMEFKAVLTQSHFIYMCVCFPQFPHSSCIPPVLPLWWAFGILGSKELLGRSHRFADKKTSFLKSNFQRHASIHQSMWS